MAVDRITRLNELLRREIGDALFHVLSADEVDLSALSILSVSVSRDLRNAHVKVSILGHEQDRRRMLAVLRRRRGAIQGLINRDLVMRYTPRLTFELDTSLEKGDHMLTLLSQLEGESGTGPAPDLSGAEAGESDSP
jgi:ribosome-binding factor A